MTAVSPLSTCGSACWIPLPCRHLRYKCRHEHRCKYRKKMQEKEKLGICFHRFPLSSGAWDSPAGWWLARNSSVGSIHWESAPWFPSHTDNHLGCNHPSYDTNTNHCGFDTNTDASANTKKFFWERFNEKKNNCFVWVGVCRKYHF